MPVSGSNGYRSGIVTLPNRVRLREMDSRSGMYPTTKRMGDTTRVGNLNIAEFDDTETVIFSKGVDNLLLGTLLESGSTRSLLPYATPNNPNGGITGTGDVIAGISDNFYMTDYKELTYRKQEGASNTENLGFFDDSRIHLSDTQFYLTGTTEDIIPGFSDRLHNKTQIVVDLSPSNPTKFGNSKVLHNVTDQINDNSGDDTSGETQQLMVYWNDALKRWEKIAFGVHGNTVSSPSDATLKTMITEAAVGFGPIGYVSTGSSTAIANQTVLNEDILTGYVRPIKSFGFPFDGKYHATGSQYILAKDLGITKPLLVEKLQLKYDVNLEFADNSPAIQYATMAPQIAHHNSNPSERLFVNDTRIVIPTFFMLRQFNGELNNYLVEYGVETSGAKLDNSYTISIPGEFKLNTGSNTTTRVEDLREIITYGQTTFYISSSDSSDLNFNVSQALENGLNRDLSVDIAKATNDLSWEPTSLVPSLTASLVMEFPCRQSSITADNTYAYVLNSPNRSTILLGDRLGGRGTGELNNLNRAIANVQPSRNISTGSAFKIPSVVSSNLPFEGQSFKKESYNLTSPYVIFPEDKLIFGWQYGMTSNLQTGFTIGTDTLTNSMTLFGSSKLTIFGSQIKENKEFHDTLNQPLTSESVHESLHYDNPVIDQYNINTRGEFTGSYIDLHRDKDASLSPEGDITIEGIASSGNNLPNSMQRFIRLTNDEQLFFDTLVPDPIKLWGQLASSGFLLQADGLRAIGIGGGTHANSGSHVVNADWLRSFAYNNNLGRVDLSAQESNLKDVIIYFPDGATSVETFTNGNGDQYIKSYKGFNFNGTNDISGIALQSSNDFSKIIKNNLMWLYGFGTGASGSLQGSNITDPASSNYQVRQRPRGYKYGILSVVPIGRSSIFRYDKFGQLADMIEQSHDTVFYNATSRDSGEGPVKINFVAEEAVGVYKILDKQSVSANTFQSSNTNVFATSSLPYFDDDTARNRVYASADGDDAKTLITIVRDEI